MAYIDTGLKNSLTSMTDWQIEINRGFQGTDIAEYDDQRKGHLVSKRPPPKETVPNNYRPIMCLSIMWKGFHKGTRGNMKATIHWSTHPQREQNETEKSSFGVDWLQKIIWYG